MKLLFTAAALVLATSVCFAYVQPGHLDPGGKLDPSITQDPQSSGANSPGAGAGPGLGVDQPASDESTQPSNPVPEPGMMVLASMGLLALGVAGRRRRER